MKTRISAVINFIYFTTNFSGGYENVVRAMWKGDPHLGNHILDKLNGILNRKYKDHGAFAPAAWLDLFFELDRTNQEVMIGWIELNYHHNREHAREISLELEEEMFPNLESE